MDKMYLAWKNENNVCIHNLLFFLENVCCVQIYNGFTDTLYMYVSTYRRVLPKRVH